MYLVTVRYKNGEALMFNSDTNQCPLYFPTPAMIYENMPSINGTITTNSRMAETPVAHVQTWIGLDDEGLPKKKLLINVYEVLDITIEDDANGR